MAPKLRESVRDLRYRDRDSFIGQAFRVGILLFSCGLCEKAMTRGAFGS